MEEKEKYNKLLSRYKNGIEAMADVKDNKEEEQKYLKELEKIQLAMNDCLMKIGEYTDEETVNGFDLSKVEVITVKTNDNNVKLTKQKETKKQEIKQEAKQENQLIVSYEVNNEQITLTPQIVQDYLVGTSAKITIPEFKLFAELCKARKLNPFLKEAYCIKYSNNLPATIVVGKDAVIKRAVLNPNYNGMKSGIIVLDDKDNIVERKGTFKLPNEKIVGGWAEVFRKDWQNSVYCSVSLEESIQRKNNGQPNSNWEKQPATMIEKVAKVRALREAFVEDLSGMYEAEEMNVNLPVGTKYIPELREVEDVL